MAGITLANPAQAFAAGYQNALRERILKSQMDAAKEERAWKQELRGRQRKTWNIEDRDRDILDKIDTTLPYIKVKPLVDQLSPEKRRQIQEYYAVTPPEERARHKEFVKMSQELGKRLLPLAKDQQSYSQVRQAVFDELRRSGIATEQEMANLQQLFPEQYDPQWVSTRLKAYGYEPKKPTYTTVKRGEVVLKDGKPIYEAPAPERKAPSGYRWTEDGRLEAIPGGPADKPDVTPATAYEKIQQARREIAKLAATHGLDGMMLLGADPGQLQSMLGDKPPEVQEAIKAYKDTIAYYEKFLRGDQDALGDPREVYRNLRDDGLSHEAAIERMRGMGFNVR